MANSMAIWSEHQAAIKREGISTSAYAKRHNIPLKNLYYWLRKVRVAAVPASVVAPKVFVALRVAEPVALPVAPSVPMGCVLILGSGMRLEMPALPSPAWLNALSRSAQGAR